MNLLGIVVHLFFHVIQFSYCAKELRKPNILLYIVDDMGWVDTGVYGSKYYETPNIDKLASCGIKFTNAYAASPSCSPTRASILTGPQCYVHKLIC
jgi:arylsulfatase A-like enzyme